MTKATIDVLLAASDAMTFAEQVMPAENRADWDSYTEVYYAREETLTAAMESRPDDETAAIKLSQAYAIQRGVLAANPLSADERKALGEAETLVRQAATLMGWIDLKPAEDDV